MSSRDPGLGTQNSELGKLHLIFGGHNWVSCRATQASHPAFHILQDNLSAIKAISRDHLLLPELGVGTGCLILTELCVETRVLELGTWAIQASHPAFHILQDNLSAIKAISRDHLLLPELGQHKPRTLVSTFYKTT
ncbi:hypothetical protein BDR07DRAFT_1371135 [Suillus spraguei]|nr:hypothetical protein BDR07DRAFT_1371135 [Suillus spraguei]